MGILGKQTEKWFLDYTVSNSCWSDYSTLTAVHQPYPLYPLPLAKGKGKRFERGASAPLKRPLFYSEESQREAPPLLPKVFPLMIGIYIHIMERGIMGVRVLVTGLKSPKTEAKIEAFEN